ncbi:DoxX family protein [Winogradskyella haliclonae]|nr:DoxX family protein [Winogradskyella haliclonae]
MKTIYWISTLILTIFLSWSAYGYFFSKTMIDGVKALGFPDFFRIQLAVLKITAVFILLIPQIPIQYKEWAYVGIGLFFITAIVAHAIHKDPLFINLINIVFFGILIISRICLLKLQG